MRLPLAPFITELAAAPPVAALRSILVSDLSVLVGAVVLVIIVVIVLRTFLLTLRSDGDGDLTVEFGPFKLHLKSIGRGRSNAEPAQEVGGEKAPDGLDPDPGADRTI